MADNINIDAGSTLTVATDDISGVHYQVVKIAHGALNTANLSSDTTPFPVTIASATLGTVAISGTVTPSTTASTITNAAANPVPVTGNINVATATLGTVTITGNVNVSSATLGTVTVSPNTTASTITNAAGNPVPVTGNINIATATLGTVTISGTVSLASTSVTVNNGTSINVNVATATLPTITLSTTGVTVSIGRTLTSVSGVLSGVTAGTLFTPTNRGKVYAYALTTTSSTEVICIFHTGGLELWRVTLAAPSGANSGSNLATAPPGFLFASRSGTAVTLSLSTAAIIHYSTAYFDEA